METTLYQVPSVGDSFAGCVLFIKRVGSMFADLLPICRIKQNTQLGRNFLFYTKRVVRAHFQYIERQGRRKRHR